MLLEKLEQIANDNTLQASGDKIKQDQRNLIRAELLDMVTQDLATKLKSDLVNVGRVEKGVVITLDNEKVGIVPIMLDLKFMGLDYDLDFEMEEYQNKLDTKAKAEQEKAKAKSEKIKADKERRQRLAEQKKAESENK